MQNTPIPKTNGAAKNLPAWFQFAPGQRYRTACALVKAGETTRAVSVLEALVTFFPDHVDALNDLGVLYCRQGDLQKAEMYFQAALALDPENPVVRHNGKALAAEQRDKASSAKSCSICTDHL